MSELPEQPETGVQMPVPTSHLFELERMRTSLQSVIDEGIAPSWKITTAVKQKAALDVAIDNAHRFQDEAIRRFVKSLDWVRLCKHCEAYDSSLFDELVAKAAWMGIDLSDMDKRTE